MSNELSGPFNKTDSGPPYVYEVSFPKNDPLFNSERWYKILKKHAWELEIPCKSRKTEDGYSFAFLKIDDYDRLLKSMEPDIRTEVEAATWYRNQLYERYGIFNKDKVTPSNE
ncbi:MAG: hypothetical protein GY797_24980 [Deltaproteobacteria bacterium]|nr:hypothetical protein [Deltaproteobacteria bacterium]